MRNGVENEVNTFVKTLQSGKCVPQQTLNSTSFFTPLRHNTPGFQDNISLAFLLIVPLFIETKVPSDRRAEYSNDPPHRCSIDREESEGQ